jgi:hypothetical protein
VETRGDVSHAARVVSPRQLTLGSKGAQGDAIGMGRGGDLEGLAQGAGT